MKHIFSISLIFGILLTVVVGFSACSFLDVPDNGPVIKGELVDVVPLTQQDYVVLDRIFTTSNPIMKEYIQTYDKLIEEVVLVDSERKLLAFCPEGVTPPTIDFKKHCLIFAMVATPTSRSEVRKIELYLQNNGDATFYTQILAGTIDNKKGLAFPYAVFDIPADKIKHLEVVSQVRYY